MNCPYCYAQGELILEESDGFKLTEPCVFCNGKGKLNIFKYLYYRIEDEFYDVKKKHFYRRITK